MSLILGSSSPILTLYIPHLPLGFEPDNPTMSVEQLLTYNSNHWRKIITIMAKVTAPNEDWRDYKQHVLLTHHALSFDSRLNPKTQWHWVGGKENQSRFEELQQVVDWHELAPTVKISYSHRILLTPYPDYRQLSNSVVELIRSTLKTCDFYSPSAN